MGKNQQTKKQAAAKKPSRTENRDEKVVILVVEDANPDRKDPAPGDVVEIGGMRMKLNENGHVVLVVRRQFGAYYSGDVIGLTPLAAHREITDSNASLHSLSVVDAPDGDDGAEEVPGDVDGDEDDGDGETGESDQGGTPEA